MCCRVAPLLQCRYAGEKEGLKNDIITYLYSHQQPSVPVHSLPAVARGSLRHSRAAKFASLFRTGAVFLVHSSIDIHSLFANPWGH